VLRLKTLVRVVANRRETKPTVDPTYGITDAVAKDYFDFVAALQTSDWWKEQNSFKHRQLLLRYKNKFISGDRDEDIAKAYMSTMSGRDFSNIIDNDEEFRNLALTHLGDNIIYTKSHKKATHGCCDHCGVYTKVHDDHIIPHSIVGDNFGGIYNHQSLCPKCNAMKSDTVLLSEVKKFLVTRARYESLSRMH
jgi:5-methylcytosine-specific restriction endonuclease McrA